MVDSNISPIVSYTLEYDHTWNLSMHTSVLIYYNIMPISVCVHCCILYIIYGSYTLNITNVSMMMLKNGGPVSCIH